MLRPASGWLRQTIHRLEQTQGSAMQGGGLLPFFCRQKRRLGVRLRLELVQGPVVLGIGSRELFLK